MDINKFEREEKKYMLSEKEYLILMKELNGYLTKDEYFKSNILNIYFDTENFDLIRKSIDKPVYKEKVRLRSYKVPSLEDKVFLEIKKKYKGVVTKRRISLKLKEFYDYYNNGIINKDSQIMKEIDYLFKYYKLVPKLFLAYNRESYKYKERLDVRITFDTNIRSRKEDLYLEMGDAGKLYFNEKVYLMEIKALNSLPISLTNILNKMKIYPVSFSKYGSIYIKESDKECLTV